MKKFYIDIDKKWGVVFAYDIKAHNLHEVGSWLEALGATDGEIKRAQETIMRINTGFTYSNPDLRMSVTCISCASDESQWWDTVIHEIDHIQDAVAEYYGVPLGTEDAAYLQGYIMRQLVNYP